jgi:hypothetical protein
MADRAATAVATIDSISSKTATLEQRNMAIPQMTGPKYQKSTLLGLEAMFRRLDKFLGKG